MSTDFSEDTLVEHPAGFPKIVQILINFRLLKFLAVFFNRFESVKIP